MTRILALCPITKNRRITLPHRVTEMLHVGDYDYIAIVETDDGTLQLLGEKRM